MAGEGDTKGTSETDPALPKEKKILKGGDQVTAVIGEVGPWQIQKILIVFLASAPGLAHIFHAGFIVPKQKFWCAQALDANGDDLPPPWTVEYYNSSLEIWPGRGNMTEGKTLGHCVPGCVNYDFDHDFWEATMVTQWDLVCEKSWLKTLAKMILFTGFVLGSFCSGLVSDRFGRKIAIWGSSVTMLVFGVITAFVPWYPVFVFTWWVTGTMAIACYTAAFVWTMEIAAGPYKTYISMSMNYSWPICRLIIAGLAWSLRNYHWHLVAISAMVGVGSVILYWLPESPRWLIAKGRMEDAKKVLSEASKKNKMPVEPEQIVLIKPSSSASQGSFFDIMKHPILRIQILIMYFNWFTTAFVMYGLALSWQNLTGGLFLNFIIGTILDFPAKTLAMILANKVGRKYPYAISSTTTGVMFMLTLFIKRDYYPSNWPIVVLALIGNFCTTLCFAILYMYTGELMPTTVRAAGVGSSSMVSKIGGTLSTTVAALADIHPAIPTIIFAVMTITSGALTIMLPETKDRKMPESLKDVESELMCPCSKKVQDKSENKTKSWEANNSGKEPGLHMSPSSVSLG